MEIQIDGGASDGEALVVDGERHGLAGILLRQCQGCGKKSRDKRENDSHNFLLINLGTEEKGELADRAGKKVKRVSAGAVSTRCRAGPGCPFGRRVSLRASQ